ncbi:MAG: NAD-dependent dehydratase [Dehalococcoidia bacterium]
MRVVVLGGTKFMGPHAVRRIAAAGHQVLVVHRGQSDGNLPPSVGHLLRDIGPIGFRRFDEGLRRELRAVRPDVVLDMIAMSEGDAREAMDTFRGVAGRIIGASSADVYLAYGRLIGAEPGDPIPVPLNEDARLRERLYPFRNDPPNDPPGFGDVYDKILVERVMLGDPDLPGTVLRLPVVFGPGDGQHRTFPYLKRMDDRRPAILLEARTAAQRMTRTYVADAGAAIAACVLDPTSVGKVYNVGERTALAEADWVRAIASAAGWRGEIVITPDGTLGGEPKNIGQDLVLNSAQIRADLGVMSETPRIEALRATIAWERANPPRQVNLAQFDYEAENALLARLRRPGTPAR